MHKFNQVNLYVLLCTSLTKCEWLKVDLWWNNHNFVDVVSDMLGSIHVLCRK